MHLNRTNLRAAILDLLALADAYERSAGNVHDPKSEALLRNFVKSVAQHWDDFMQRMALSPIGQGLVDQVAAAYARVTADSTREALKADLIEVFAKEGTPIDDRQLNQLLVSRQDITERAGDSAGGPKETARSRLGRVFGDISANTVKAVAREHGELGIPEAFTPYAYRLGRSLPAVERYICELLAEERQRLSEG